MTKKWKGNVVRNYDGVQFGELRREIEAPYNAVHDKVSACYYDGEPFGEYGILDKATFDMLHGLVFHHLAVRFHEENMKLPVGKRYDEAEYNSHGEVDDARSQIKKHDDNGFNLDAAILEAEKELKEKKAK